MRPKDVFSGYKGNDENFLKKLKSSNPNLWKKLKKQFEIGRQIVDLQLHNCLSNSNETTIRYYLSEYVSRFLQFGPHAFPTSYNVLEPFFNFNLHNSIIHLVDEEESYSLSLLDYLNFVTSKDFNLEHIDYYESIPEKIIYHFQFNSDFEEYNFFNNNETSFYIGSLSIVRQGNQVSMLLKCGETYDKIKSEKDLKHKTKDFLEGTMDKRKKSLGLKIGIDENESKVVNFNDKDNLWSHNVALLFDIERKAIDIRHVARDENLSFKVLTDDFQAIFGGHTELKIDEKKRIFEKHLKELSKYDAIFDFAKYCLALPYYVFENEEKLVDVTYETKLSELLSSVLIKRKYRDAPSKYKIHAKSMYYLESDSHAIIKNHELNDNSFQVEKSGYWKRIGVDEEGFDKHNRKVIGKTWVERSDVFSTVPKVITKVKEVKKFTDPDAGYIYIMRQPAHDESIFKIGLTKRDAETRGKELSNTSTIDKFFIIHKYLTKNCVKAEKIIHEKLDVFRLSSRREFFKCELELIMNMCAEVVSKINSEE